MSRFRMGAAWACTAALLIAADAGALSIDYAALSDQSSSSIVQLTGGVTVTATAFGGATNPQTTMTPTTGPSGGSALNVNIGGSSLFGTRGLGCGAVASQCDLIAPVGEDVIRLNFSTPVQLDQVVLAALEDPDDVRWFRWTGSTYALAGSDTCTTFSFCGGNETYNGPFGTSQSWIFVAENSGASAFDIRSVNFTVPEPGTALLVALGLGAVVAKRRNA